MLADAFAAGVSNLPGTAALDQRLVSLSNTLATYGQNPGRPAGARPPDAAASSLRSPLAFLTPVQSSCNYVTLFLRNIASVLSESTTSGTSLRFSLVAIDDVLGGEAVPSQQPYTTPQTDPDRRARSAPRQSVPEHRLARRRPPNARPATSRTRARRRTSATPPGNQGLQTEKTSQTGRRQTSTSTKNSGGSK